MPDDANSALALQERFDSLRQRYEAGDRTALLDAVFVCLNHPITAPQWVQSAFGKGYVRYTCCQARDLGEAFEIERPKGFHVKAARKKISKLNPVYLRVYHLHHHEGHPIDSALFEKVAEEFEINKTDVSDWYYEQLQAIREATNGQ